MMTPLKPDNITVSGGEFPQISGPETPTIDPRFAELADKLVISLQNHSASLQKDISQNIYQITEIHEIHNDCVQIQKLCQVILSSHIPLMNDKQLLTMIDSLSSIEHQLRQQDNELEILGEIKNEIKELHNAINWTKQIYSESQPSEKTSKAPENTQGFWKTLLKVVVFSGLLWKGEAYSDLQPPQPTFAGGIQPLEHESQTFVNPLDSHQFNHLTCPVIEGSDTSLAALAVHIGQTGQQCMSTSSVYEPQLPTVSTDHPSTSWLVHSLRHIQNSVEIQRLDNFVSNSSIPIDNQLLLHLIGDTYGKGTELEGANTVRNLEYLLNILDQELYHLEQNPSYNEEEREEFCQAFFEGTEIGKGVVFSKSTLENLREQVKRAISVGRWLDGEFSDFYKAALHQVRELHAIGDSFFFPIHWPKHALACEIIKDAGDSYAVRIYNTGEGSESYSELYTFSGLKKLPFVEVIGVTLKNLENPAFYNGLSSLAKKKEMQKPEKTLYHHILPILKGTPSDRSYSVEEHLTPQISGTCSMRVLSGIFCQLLSNAQHCHQLNWKLGLKALADFYHQHNDDLKINIISRNNLRKGLTEFVVLSRELRGKNYISADAFQYASGIVEEISTALDASEQSYEKMQQESRSGCEVTTALAVLPPTIELGEYKFDWAIAFFPDPLKFG